MKRVLILSYEDDPHVEAVSSYLKKQGVDFFIVETEKIIEKYGLSFDSKNGLYKISDGDRKVFLDEGWNIWNRRVMDPIVPEGVPKDLEDIIFTETKRTWQGLLFTHRGKVVNRPQAEFAANNKVDQFLFAKNYGLPILVPETILTNDPSMLKFFYEQEGGKICHKLQKAAVVMRNGEHYITYNNLVRKENLQYADLIRRNPSLFQRYIEKDYELRITALEEKVVAVAIHSQDSEQSKIDFRRYDFENVKYERVDLPETITDFCEDLLKHYNLSFGEIDMVVTPKQEYVFLELNPNGQWLWLELKSGYDLTSDVVENLL